MLLLYRVLTPFLLMLRGENVSINERSDRMALAVNIPYIHVHNYFPPQIRALILLELLNVSLTESQLTEKNRVNNKNKSKK